jgi:hypothetical protein
LRLGVGVEKERSDRSQPRLPSAAMLCWSSPLYWRPKPSRSQCMVPSCRRYCPLSIPLCTAPSSEYSALLTGAVAETGGAAAAPNCRTAPTRRTLSSLRSHLALATASMAIASLVSLPWESTVLSLSCATTSSLASPQRESTRGSSPPAAEQSRGEQSARRGEVACASATIRGKRAAPGCAGAGWMRRGGLDGQGQRYRWIWASASGGPPRPLSGLSPASLRPPSGEGPLLRSSG